MPCGPRTGIGSLQVTRHKDSCHPSKWYTQRHPIHMCLPPNLLHAVSAPNGGRVVLVLGAGCSAEDPTGLPLSRQCSLEAHRRLLADGLLQEGQCPEPGDLSQLADTVKHVTGHQAELVARLPRNDFLVAQANKGYLIAAALLREHAILAVMTLNFDLAMSSALARVGGADVAVVAGPEDHANLGVINLIYLHRNAHAVAESWILTTAALAEEWKGAWEEVIAMRVLASSVTVFAGLGTPAGVLVETTKRIREAKAQGEFYVVGPLDPDQSTFLAAMHLSRDNYLQMGWGQFMTALANRVSEEHRARLDQTCTRLIHDEGWHAEDVAEICRRFAQLGLLDTGAVRARWLLNKGEYEPARSVDPALVADLVLAVALVERSTGKRAVFGNDGIVEFRDGQQIAGAVVLASGRGTKRWFRLEADLRGAESSWNHRDPRPRFAIVAATSSPPGAASTPDDLVSDFPEDDILGNSGHVKMVHVDSLRANEALASNLVS